MNPLIEFKKATPVLLVWFALVCFSLSPSAVTGTRLAVSRPEASMKISHPAAAGLTFTERLAYQRIIEDVYWRHRIWPKENPNPKPSLDAVMTQAQLEKKVTDYLRKSQTLEDYWQRPITADQLQTEMDRMAQHTRQPEVLRELFQALGNDPFVIAECLARPVLAERLLTHPASEQVGQTSRTSEQVVAATSDYSLPSISDEGGCTDDTWTATSTMNAPSDRLQHTAIWTGSEMIIWGGQDNSGFQNTGGRYNPSTDSWIATSTTNAPQRRKEHTAIWTGSEMIVWGGVASSPHYSNTGGRYNPGTDSWTATSTTNVPTARYGHMAVWTGSEMIVWGGSGNSPTTFNTGGRYNPRTDSWRSTSTTGAPPWGRGVWSGTEMIVWNGNVGARYNPVMDGWTPISTTNAPRSLQGAVWTGREMIVWGGHTGTYPDVYFNTGGRYDPNTDSWTATSTTNAPTGRTGHTAVWANSEMIIWSGWGPSFFNTGGRYNPTTDSWTATSTTNAPYGRDWHTAIWTGSEMIVWGGNNPYPLGARYCAYVAPQLGNISTRAFVQTGDNVVIGGFIVQGTQTKRVIIRAIGPELTRYGVPNVLINPTLELHDATGALIASNNNWMQTIIGGIITNNQVHDILASGYAPGNFWESAIIADLTPGNYTAIVRGVNDMTGVGLVEAYDLSPETNSLLANISTRAFVQTGDDVMIGGFIVQGTQPKRVIVRAIGPELMQYGVPNALTNPTLELHDGTGALIASNDNWRTTIIGGVITSDQVAEIRASGNAPGDGRESAIIATLPAGNYTVIVRGVNNTIGVGLIEVYDLGE